MSWSNENKSCMRVEKRELYKSSLNSYVLVKWEQELYESWWELTSESLYESFLNSGGHFMKYWVGGGRVPGAS